MKEYSLVIASNFLDHYMLALSLELQIYFKDYRFIASEKLEDNYKKLGFSDLNDSDMVIKAYEDKQKAKEIISEADIVITGSYTYQNHIRNRIAKGKPVVYYSERLFKSDNITGRILRYIKYNIRHHRDKEAILLCVSAYAAGDYNSIGLFKGKTYKFGYFPQIKEYPNINKLLGNKKRNSLIWVGRLIEWKHPDYAIEIAKKLKDEGYDFSLKLIGNGEMKEKLHQMIDDYQLNDSVVMFDQGMSPEDVRKHMEESEIYLFTSDKGEGWGVVLNEALNSACACVASFSAGSTPFLVQDGINGYIYKNDDVRELFERTKQLLDSSDTRKLIEENAYQSIIKMWNCKTAAERISIIAKNIVEGKSIDSLYADGILSKADPIK